MEAIRISKANDRLKAKLLMPLERLNVSARMENVLCGDLGMGSVYDLLPVEHEELLNLPNFGQKTLTEVLGVLSELKLDPRTVVEVHEDDDISISARLKIIQDHIVTERVQSLLVPEGFSDPQNFRDELLYNSHAVANANNDVPTLLNRWGWTGRPPRTLREVGSRPELSGRASTVTRERIRQLEKSAKENFSVRALKTKYMRQLYEAIFGNLPLSYSAFTQLLETQKTGFEDFDPIGFVDAVKLILKEDIQFNKNYEYFYNNSSNIENLFKKIRRLSSSNMAANFFELSNQYNLSKNEMGVVTDFVDRSEEYLFFGEEKAWIKFQGTARDRGENILRKIFSLNEMVDLKVLYDQFYKGYRITTNMSVSDFGEYVSIYPFIQKHENTVRRLVEVKADFGGMEKFFIEKINSITTSRTQDLEREWEASGFSLSSLSQTLYKSSIVENKGGGFFRLFSDVDSVRFESISEVSGTTEKQSFLEQINANINRMIDSAFAASAQSGRIRKASTYKEKTLILSRFQLEKIIRDLLEGQEYNCAISNLKFDFEGSSFGNEKMPSLDRIDSSKGYEKENLQVLCSFINRWKSDQENEFFKSLIGLLYKQ